MNSALKLEDRHYTYADYYAWDLAEGERYELIYGEAYEMAAPSRIHQEILGALFVQLHTFLKGKPCKVYAAPLDVRLFAKEDESDDTVVQPDIIVVCDHSKWDKKDSGYNGAPTLAIEILSPSNRAHDNLLKFNLYRDAGVKEYWVVDPEMKGVHIHSLTDAGYLTVAYGEKAAAPVGVLEGCVITLADAFGE